MLFASGFIWLTILMVLSVYKPWNYNGIDGFRGFLLGTDMVEFFIVALGLVLIVLLTVLLTVLHEIRYKPRFPEWMKQNKIF